MSNILPDIYCPPFSDRLLRLGAALVISISGGKDSQAMLMALVIEYHRRGWTGPLFALHMDLGRTEWLSTSWMCKKMAYTAGIDLVVIRRPQGDLVSQIEARMLKLTAEAGGMQPTKPFWPSVNSRYCTSDQKRDQANKVLRAPGLFWPGLSSRYYIGHHKTNQVDKQPRKFPIVISAEGIRGAESPRRAKLLEKPGKLRVLQIGMKGQNLILSDAQIGFSYEKPH